MVVVVVVVALLVPDRKISLQPRPIFADVGAETRGARRGSTCGVEGPCIVQREPGIACKRGAPWLQTLARCTIADIAHGNSRVKQAAIEQNQAHSPLC